jgi:hypothetical protein
MRAPLTSRPREQTLRTLNGPIQRKRAHGRGTGGGTARAAAPPVVEEVLGSPGRPLDAASRAFMESRFQHDFSRVRVHTDARAGSSASEIDARAYTAGRHVVFGTGQYAPHVPGGQRLLAHELTHVVQQEGSGPAAPAASSRQASRPGDAAEREAESVADAVLGGRPVQVEQRAGAGIQGSFVMPPKPEAEGRRLDWMTMKRKDKDLMGSGGYGHWWTEISPEESYGWWPKYPITPGLRGLWETFTGVDGELNGQTSSNGTPTRDPYHGDPADKEFHPVLTAPEKTDDRVRDEVRAFANSYSGEWRWTLGWGQNCWTFQTGLMTQVGLAEP